MDVTIIFDPYLNAKKMKTYLVPCSFSFIATEAANSAAAFAKVSALHPGARKSGVRLSAVNIDFVSCGKI